MPKWPNKIVRDRCRGIHQSEKDSSDSSAWRSEFFKGETHSRFIVGSLHSVHDTRSMYGPRRVNPSLVLRIGFLGRRPPLASDSYISLPVNALRKEALINRERDATTPPYAAAAARSGPTMRRCYASRC